MNPVREQKIFRQRLCPQRMTPHDCAVVNSAAFGYEYANTEIETVLSSTDTQMKLSYCLVQASLWPTVLRETSGAA
jgi:hypothetical protein